MSHTGRAQVTHDTRPERPLSYIALAGVMCEPTCLRCLVPDLILESNRGACVNTAGEPPQRRAEPGLDVWTSGCNQTTCR